tara:strand:- start:695 stop:1195 length:501 start_codon:yes stop_codon:yes gene_type:complete
MTGEKIKEALSTIDNAGLQRPYLNEKYSVSHSEIEEAEKLIGFRFPESYRMFLSFLGSGDFQSAEFYGLIPNRLNLEEIPNALWFTKDLRENMDLPDGLLAFHDFDGDAVACLALADMTEDECPVVLWDHTEDHVRQLKKPHILADTFGDYFYNKIKELVNNASPV